MATTARCCFVFLILGASVQVQALWNFRAVGEFVAADEVADCSGTFSSSPKYFVETHYSEGNLINKTALHVQAEPVDDFNFFGDFNQGQAYVQLSGECENAAAGGLIRHFDPWKFGSEAMYAPVYLIMSELHYLIIDEDSLPVVERGLPATRFRLNLTDKTYANNEVEVAYITLRQKDDDFDGGYENIIPLSVEFCFANKDEDGKVTRSKERLSIMEFNWNMTVEQDVSPGAGIHCAGYGRKDLPPVFDVDTLVARMEQVIDESVTTSDAVLDFKKGLLRIDDGKNDYYLSTSQSLIFNVSNPDVLEQSCNILKADEVLKFPFTFVDFQAKSAKDFFGVDENFTVKTKSKRRGMDCDVVSGIRSDYLPEKGGLSVWEWCIGEIKTAQGVQKYMVHLDIFMHADSSVYHESYSLYDVENVDPKQLYLDYFTELEPCFEFNQKRNLQIVVDSLSSNPKDDIETAIESPHFKAELLDQVGNASGLFADTYRFGSTKAIIFNESAVFQFYLLDAPADAPVGQSLDDIYEKLKKAISETTMTVNVNGIKFEIRKDSLADAHEIIVPPVPPTTTTPQPTTAIPTTTTKKGDDDGTTTTKKGDDDGTTTTKKGDDGTTTTTKSSDHGTTTTTESSDDGTTTTQRDDGETTTQSGETTTKGGDDNGDDFPPVAPGYHGALVWGLGFAVLLLGGFIGVVAARYFLPQK